MLSGLFLSLSKKVPIKVTQWCSKFAVGEEKGVNPLVSIGKSQSLHT